MNPAKLNLQINLTSSQDPKITSSANQD